MSINSVNEAVVASPVAEIGQIREKAYHFYVAFAVMVAFFIVAPFFVPMF